MADQLQLRRGTTSEILLFTGAQGEVIVDTDKNTIVVQDGITAGGFPLATEQSVANGTFYFNDDTGGGSAADAYLLTPKVNTNTPTAYLDGIQLGFVTANANTGPSTADFAGIGVRNIKYADGTDPGAGDINGRVNIVYDQVNDWFELQPSVEEQDSDVRSIAASVALNAMTLTLQPCTIDFRSSIPSNGATSRRNVIAPISLVIPAGATLGTVNGVQSKLAVIAVDTGSSVALAVVNTSQSIVLDESTLINTLAITAGSSSDSAFYSTAPQSGVPYRVVGFVESTQTIAGTWGAAPTKVQGQGGQALVKAIYQPFTKEFISSQQVITAGGSLSIAHGLGTKPKLIDVTIICLVADGGYAIGAELNVTYSDANGASSYGVGVDRGATNLSLKFGVTGLTLINATTGAAFVITPANWRLVARAWA